MYLLEGGHKIASHEPIEYINSEGFREDLVKVVTVGGGLIIVEEDGEYAWRHLVKCKIHRYVSETELHCTLQGLKGEAEGIGRS